MSRRPDTGEAAAAASGHRGGLAGGGAPQSPPGVAVAAGLGGPGTDGGGLAWQPIAGGAGDGASAVSAAATAAAAVAMPASAAWEAIGDEARTERRADTLPRQAPLPPPVLALLAGALDLGLLALAGALAALLAAAPARDGLELLSPEAPKAATGGGLAVAALLAVAFAASRGAYRPATLFCVRRQLRALLPATFGAAACTAFAALAFGVAGEVDARWSALAVPLAAALLMLGRGALTTLLRTCPWARAAAAPRAVILAAGGDGKQAARLAEALVRTRAGDAIRLLGVVDGGLAPRGPAATRLAGGVPLLGPVETLFAMIRRGEVDQVIVAMPWAAEARGLALLRRLADYAVEVRLAPDLLAYHGRRRRGAPRTALLPAGGFEPVLLVSPPISGWAAAFKAVEDYVLALAVLAVTAVPMALIALAIRLDSPGPVLFRQRRIGLNGRPFDVFKFRTMYHEAADPLAQCQVREGDPRVTPVGALLRRTSLDELPQIFNVLRGEMSVVGPRPHAPGTRAGGKLFEEVTPLYAARHRVKPGLTGLAQVRGWRGPTETEEKLIRRVESDLEYIENWSPWLDAAIILRTLVAVARMRNAC